MINFSDSLTKVHGPSLMYMLLFERGGLLNTVAGMERITMELVRILMQNKVGLYSRSSV
jgi:hypothetical protein